MCKEFAMIGRKCKTVWERFWPKVNKDGQLPEHRPELGPCWVWTGSLDKDGYGRLRGVGGRSSLVISSHRLSWERVNGPLPDNLEFDHLCRNRRCCNPTHLEAVTHAVNVKRGNCPSTVLHRAGLCKRGHVQGQESTYYHKTGPRAGNASYCLVCAREKRKVAIHEDQRSH